jgi:hypothetical protein
MSGFPIVPCFFFRSIAQAGGHATPQAGSCDIGEDAVVVDISGVCFGKAEPRSGSNRSPVSFAVRKLASWMFMAEMISRPL